MQVTLKIINQNYLGHLLSENSLIVSVKNDDPISDNVLNDVLVANETGLTLVADFLVIRTLTRNNEKHLVLQVVKNSLLCLFNNQYSQELLAEGATIRKIEKDYQTQSSKKIENAIRDKGFLIYYQPKVDVETQNVIGFEALARWQHPEKGLLLPGEFLPLIDNCGYQFLFDVYVLSEVMKQQSDWAALGYEIPVSINVSSGTILNDLFCHKFIGLLDHNHDLSPNLIQLELLETSHFFNIESARDKLKKIRDMGVEIAFDDFGTGYSTFEYIKNIEADYVKIDRAFICDGLSCPKNKVIVSTIVQLAEAFGAKVVAEGIENVKTMEQVRDAGCHIAQGYYFSKPIPSTKVMDWLFTKKKQLNQYFSI
jgi:EAL domain-containing protein (putative c-di-GMP-specific phosphodiesterase class I)